MTNGLPVGASVTPVILTYNEAPNIGRTLDALRWADRVVVVDSGSADATESIARQFPNVAWFTRPFDSHQAQWTYAIRETGIDTEYVLALDADYRVPPAFVDECRMRFVPGGYDGGIASFDYEVLGRTLMGSVYPSKPVIFRPAHLRIEQPGHSQEMRVDGKTYVFEAHLVHDDRKPVSRFVTSQIEYSRLEAQRLANGGSRWQDAVRRTGIMPLIAGVGAYLKAGGPLRGRSALRYAYERLLFECMLAMRVLERPPESDAASRTREHAIARDGLATASSGVMSTRQEAVDPKTDRAEKTR
ncbi:MAG TPA: glycosyltransferase family 2 protein [Thermoanaerobaculia bacterium]